MTTAKEILAIVEREELEEGLGEVYVHVSPFDLQVFIDFANPFKRAGVSPTFDVWELIGQLDEKTKKAFMLKISLDTEVMAANAKKLVTKLCASFQTVIEGVALKLSKDVENNIKELFQKSISGK